MSWAIGSMDHGRGGWATPARSSAWAAHRSWSWPGTSASGTGSTSRCRPREHLARGAEERLPSPVVQAANATHLRLLEKVGEPSIRICAAFRVLQSMQDSWLASNYARNESRDQRPHLDDRGAGGWGLILVPISRSNGHRSLSRRWTLPCCIRVVLLSARTQDHGKRARAETTRTG